MKRDLDQGAGLDLNSDLIPSELRYLIPVVERWGFQRPHEQDAFVDRMTQARPHEVNEFNSIIDDAKDAIAEWSRSLTQLTKQMSDMSDEDWNHPYWSFLATLKVRELTVTPVALDPNRRSLKEANWKTLRSQVAELFRVADYNAFVDVVSPYEEVLSSVELKKLKLARKRTM